MCGGDLINFVNQSGLKGKTTLAVGLLFITDIHSLGVDQFEGTQFTDAWYWNLRRRFADRFMAKSKIRPVLRPCGQLLGGDELSRGCRGHGPTMPTRSSATSRARRLMMLPVQR